MKKSNDAYKTVKPPKVSITGSGVVHIRASELAKSTQVKSTAQKLLNNTKIIPKN